MRSILVAMVLAVASVALAAAPAGTPCNANATCDSGVCGSRGQCQPPRCSDAAKNGTETCVDGGGDTCPRRCSSGETCTASSDCMTGKTCTAGRCQ